MFQSCLSNISASKSCDQTQSQYEYVYVILFHSFPVLSAGLMLFISNRKADYCSILQIVCLMSDTKRINFARISTVAACKRTHALESLHVTEARIEFRHLFVNYQLCIGCQVIVIIILHTTLDNGFHSVTYFAS